jgi:23S rRNA (guanine745-N1)-methyltransferase
VPAEDDDRVPPEILAVLRCPVCRQSLAGAGRPPADTGRALRCPAGHSFDLARQGYVDLTGGRVTHPGDTAEMVAARAALLDAGHFRPIGEVVAALTATAPAGLVVDVGAGTGHHLAALLDARPADRGLALDVSRPALRRAAAAHPRAGAARADVWRGLPVVDGAAGLILDVFAPRSGAEFARILRPGGLLVVVTPTPEHLRELVAAGGLLRVDPDKRARLSATLDRWFEPAGRHRHDWTLRPTPAEVRALVAMGPNAWHADAGRVAAAVAPGAQVTASIEVTLWSRLDFVVPMEQADRAHGEERGWPKV